MKVAVAAISVALTLSGCMQGGPFRTSQLSPSQFAAANQQAGTVAGIKGGGLIGSAIGADLDRRALRMAMEAEYRALESTPAGQAVQWGEVGTNWKGTVRAAQPYRVGSQDCRQYTQTVEIDGAQREAKGTACRNADGSWTLLS